MTKRDKLLKNWKTNTPTTAKRSEVESILDIYFPGEYSLDGGSHIVVESEQLKLLQSTSPYGILTIPLKSGRHVKRVYLKKLIKVIEEIQQLEEASWEK